MGGTKQKQVLLEELPGDVRDKNGRRSRKSRWARRRVEVAIDQETIDNAVQSNSNHCMIADAIKKQMPHVRFVSVDLQSIKFSDPEKRVRYNYLTPREAQRALIQFDRGIPPKPMKIVCSQVTITQMPTDVRHGGQKLIKPRVTSGDAPKSKRQKPLNSGAQVVAGGLPFPTHYQSAVRRFGLKAFTWDDEQTRA